MKPVVSVQKHVGYVSIQCFVDFGQFWGGQGGCVCSRLKQGLEFASAEAELAAELIMTSKDTSKKSEKNDVCVFDVNFSDYNQLPIVTKLPDNSIVVEMYPLSGNLKTRVSDEIKKLKNYEYIKFWE